jgi:CBS domain-containing protein
VSVDGELIGILTERDCMRVAMHAEFYAEPGGPVSEYMTADPHSVAPGESILNVAQAFIDGRFHRYPVVDDGRLVGIISRRDIMRALGEHYPL